MADTPIIQDEKAAVRAVVFAHLSGIVLAPTIQALADRKIFDFFPDAPEEVNLDGIVARTGGNRGYLRVALRLLASCGWLTQRLEENGRSPRYALTAEGSVALELAPPLCHEVVSFIPRALFLEDFLFGKSDKPVLATLQALVRGTKEHWGMIPHADPIHAKVGDQIRRYLDGMVVGPTMVALARAGILDRLRQGAVDPKDIDANQASLECALELLAIQGWLAREQNGVRLTSCGQYAAQIATSYGVTVSYLPLFDVVDTLLFGNPRIPRMDESGVELLVNRGMNIWGSGGAHTTYFKKVDEIIVEIFNRPVESQPQGICDMGCGDGAFLEHLYTVVKNKTARGGVLDKHPLILVGVDFNKVARRVAKQNMRKAEISSCHVIAGDINRPAQLAGDLEELGLDIHDLLHVRSFLDHNRPYSPPANYVRGSRRGKSTGAFAYMGEEIPPDELEENLVRHLRRWGPYVGRFGLLNLELHTLPPDLTAANLERTPAVAYDGTHGFSDQYLVELPIFLDCAREAGLESNERFQSKFPANELATVSLSYFTAPGAAHTYREPP
ncbi:MAG: methyltransferase domain-containing protein [Candidatus Acidiferrales bacterium]